MSKYLVFDTETTGFPSKDLPADHPNQAHIVQLACVVLDEQYFEVGSFYTLVKPKYWTYITEGASNAHGITKDKCEKYGMDIESVLKVFIELCRDAKFVIAHNLKFDKQMIQIDYTRMLGGVPMNTWPQTICTMECTTNICQIAPKFKNGSTYKWPKLQEAYEFLFKETFSKAHDALADVRATARVFKWLKDNKKVG